MKTRKLKLVVELRVPAELTTARVRNYVDSAVEQWSKGGDADDPLWNVKVLDVKDYDRVMRAELIKRGVSKRELLIKVTPEGVRDVIAMVMFDGLTYEELDVLDKGRVESVMTKLTGGRT